MIEYMKAVKKIKDSVLYSLPDYMKVTASLQIREMNSNLKQIKYGFDERLFSGQYDAKNTMDQLADTNYKFSDFKTDHLTALSEVDINFQFIFMTLLVLFLITVIIIMNNKFNVIEGIMDIVSMSLGMGIISPIGRLSMKIIYFFGFLFIFVVMPEFQGQISAILSQPARRNVETLQDLFDNKYHVFYNGLLQNDMINKQLWVTEEDQKYLHPSGSLDLEKCAPEAQQNSTIACIDLTLNQLLYALKLQNLYVSKEITFKKYYVFWTRKNWALKDKIDKVRSIPMELIDKCFANSSNPLMISSDFVEDQVASRSIDNGSPLIVINGDQRWKQFGGYLPSYPTYIVRFESMKKLAPLIFGIMKSTIWDIKSPIFILDISKGTHDRRAHNILSFLKNFDILVSYYVCYDDKKDSTMVYTLNPYTRYAPSPWNQVKFANDNGNNQTKMTLYSLQYPKDLKNNYKNIYFDKTEHLDGHKIKLMVPVIEKNLPKQSKQRHIIEYMKVVKKIKDYLFEEIEKKQWKKIEKIEKIKEAENYERTDFDNLVFYVIVFGASLLWSLVIFGIELMVYRIHCKYQRREKERRQFIERLRAQPRIILPRMELIDRSFANNSNPLIISSDLVDDQVASRSIDNGSPLIVINGDQRRNPIEGFLPSYPTYILKLESSEKLVPLIIGFMESTIWNIKSPIFIVDISEGTHDVNASVVLASLAGRFDILVTYYVCYDDKKDSTMVYTLNPYTQYAPSPWNQVKFANDNGNNQTKMTLYSLQYPKDLNDNNKNIYFDKTEQLDGHEIKLLVPLFDQNLPEKYKP
ncbi:Protein of unknown function [Cotesia congregata]|uniref:Uncharacterized protein n=1 Tax=Cotesia congregata TaxID=51543 RepID=A0A8J2H559_COTCN|nr:Protein of unknown function [Cotesia congregata]